MITPVFVPVYLDESGSLPDQASHFIIAVCVNTKGEPIERMMRKVRRRIPKIIRRTLRRISVFELLFDS